MIRFIVSLFFLVSLALFYSVYISPEYFPYIGLLTLTNPLLLCINAFIFISLVFAKRKLAILPFIALIAGWKYVGTTFQYNIPTPIEDRISVLSYNVHMFNYHHQKSSATLNSENLVKWIQDNPSDIKCFQEFYQDFTTPSKNHLKQLATEAGYEYSYQINEGNVKKRSYGMAILSKYPIVNDGKVFENRRNNGVIFADIKIDKDTIRVYNAHLESMSIDKDNLNNLEGIKENYRETLRKLKNGQVIRASQLDILKEHMDNCPYPTILVGDFNDVPYSYTYFFLRKNLDNAFEKAGRGFGFTYNRVLFFLRIDNIFFDPSFQISDFKTHREVDYSDHYPISATFEKPFFLPHQNDQE
ncbi:endonuclease/exonuclease/phosphatase family protein [Mongoliitalea daihaiensis]|uniref:endonuclease/exonuclease/phosphatase family protein n=1 Tax=Mongoliitalea daihaiensis TaxID=2782006 RepID=UPI001F374B40|nr:endonuclease/exonuclease/phosphatase family protein [Mongoliitalea daihaiensis]UJP63368.1 endonuclease/exonuclease/phosphatase family protein [Mongoliitalea daihaiensis]